MAPPRAHGHQRTAPTQTRDHPGRARRPSRRPPRPHRLGRGIGPRRVRRPGHSRAANDTTAIGVSDLRGSSDRPVRLGGTSRGESGRPKRFNHRIVVELRGRTIDRSTTRRGARPAADTEPDTAGRGPGVTSGERHDTLGDADAAVQLLAEAAPQTARVEQTAAGSIGAGSAVSDDQIDRLAGRLYPRLRDRWRNELRLEHERAGRVSDVRI